MGVLVQRLCDEHRNSLRRELLGEELDVTAAAQFELEDQLQAFQGGNLALEVGDHLLDLGLGVRSGHGPRS